MRKENLATPNREYFIDVARVLAFTSVVVGHKFWSDYLSVSESGNPNLSFTSFLKPAFSGGAAGVVLFFLVSGYVITKALVRENLQQFVSSRFFRIYPSFWLALAIFWLLQINGVSSAPSISSKVSSASLFGDFSGTSNQLNNVDWTLRLEILFYTCCAICLFFSKVLRAFSRATSNWQRRLSYLLLLFLLLNLPIFPRNGFTGYISIFSFIFLGGIWIALFDLKKVSKLETLFVVLSSFIAHIYSIGMIRPDLYLFGAFSFYGYFTFIFLFVIRHRLGTSKIVLQLSSMTYLVYLFHNWLLDKFFGWFQWLPLGPDGTIPLISRLTSLIIFLGVMWLIHVVYEKPIIKLGKKISSRNWRSS
jgi:peptidoglycan/LPS O-acetylase OafA/YrhL